MAYGLTLNLFLILLVSLLLPDRRQWINVSSRSSTSVNGGRWLAFFGSNPFGDAPSSIFKLDWRCAFNSFDFFISPILLFLTEVGCLSPWLLLGMLTQLVLDKSGLFTTDPDRLPFPVRIFRDSVVGLEAAPITILGWAFWTMVGPIMLFLDGMLYLKLDNCLEDILMGNKSIIDDNTSS